jgi:diacylglycerol O-acyltransferase / trehalose O-mycolyltransferase
MVKRYAVGLASVVLVVAGCATGTVSPSAAPSTAPTAPIASIASTAGPLPSASASPSQTAARSSQSTAPATIGEAADDGARVTEVEQKDARTVDLTVDSPAVGTVVIRLLLPAGFDAQPARTWPILYLLHGAQGSHHDWTELTDVAALTASTDLIVAMPDGGEWSWYADAWNSGNGGRPMWETFHVTEMRQLLERNWHASDRRALAGLSMGGLGAMDYAARHPDLFVGAASFSGVLDPLGAAPHPYEGTIVFGDPAKQVDNWKAHDPLYLAPALSGHALYISYGNGMPGPLEDGSADNPDEIEPWVQIQNDDVVAELKRLNIPATVEAYGAGTHSWPYWQRGLHEALPILLDALAKGN